MCYMKKKEICPVYISKHNSNHKNHFLINSNAEGWPFIVVRKLWVLLSGFS